MDSVELPSDIPQDLADAAFLAANGEAAWPPSVAARAAEWLGDHGYAVLGTDLWVIKPNGTIVTLPLGLSELREVHGNTVNRDVGETWGSFTRRAATETLDYLSSFNPGEIVEEGDLRFNITWVNEAEFEQLRAR